MCDVHNDEPVLYDFIFPTVESVFNCGDNGNGTLTSNQYRSSKLIFNQTLQASVIHPRIEIYFV